MTAPRQDRLVDVDAVQAPAAARAPVGAGKTFRAYDPDQVLLLSPVPQDWIPDGDLAHFVSDLVENGALDLFGIYASYEDERGFRRMTRGSWARHRLSHRRGPGQVLADGVTVPTGVPGGSPTPDQPRRARAWISTPSCTSRSCGTATA
jgi:hypothetical protein